MVTQPACTNTTHLHLHVHLHHKHKLNTNTQMTARDSEPREVGEVMRGMVGVVHPPQLRRYVFFNYL